MIKNINCNVLFTSGQTKQYNSNLYGIRKWILENEINIQSNTLLILDATHNKIFNENLLLQQSRIGRTQLNLQVKDSMQIYNEGKYLKKVIDDQKVNLKTKEEIILLLQTDIQKQKEENKKLKLEIENILNNDQSNLSQVILKHTNEINNFIKENEEQMKNLNNQVQDLNGEIQLKNQEIDEQNRAKLEKQQYYEIAQEKLENDLKNEFQVQIQELEMELNTKFQEQYLINQQWQIAYKQLEQYCINYQQQLQQYDQQKKDIEVQLVQQQKQYDNLIKKYENEKILNTDFENQISQLDNELKNKNKKLQTKKREIINLQQQLQDKENEIEQLCNQANDKNKILQIKIDDQLKNAKNKVIKQEEEIYYLKEQLANKNQENTQILIVNQQTIKKFQQLDNEYDQLQQKYKTYGNKAEGEIDKFQKLFNKVEKDNQENIQLIRQYQQEKQQLQIELQNNVNQIENLKRQIVTQSKNFNMCKQAQENDIMDFKQKCDKVGEELKLLKIQNTNLYTEKKKIEIELELIKKTFQQEKQNFEQQIKNYVNYMKIFEEENNKLTLEKNVLDKIIQQIQEKQIYKPLGKNRGLCELLLKDKTIESYFQDPNGMLDQKKYELFQLKTNDNLLEKLFKNHDIFDLNQAVEKQSLGNINVRCSIQKNQETDLFCGFLIQIIESTNLQLKGKYLLKIELKQQQNTFNLTNAIQLSLNSLICQFFLQRFKQHLKIAGLKNDLNLSITNQFILKTLNKEEYWYAYLIENGQLNRINGGDVDINQSQIDQFCNSFSLYTYELMKKLGVITYISVQNNKLIYDIIFSSQYKIISQIDQGKQEIAIFLNKIQQKSQDYFGLYFNEKLRALAQNEFLLNKK